MDIESFIIEFEKFSSDVRGYTSPASLKSINAFEKKYALVLPEAYKQLLSYSNGIDVFYVNMIYGIGSRCNGLSISDVYKREHFKKDGLMPLHYVPFSHDEKGNLYCFDTNNDSVILWEKTNGSNPGKETKVYKDLFEMIEGSIFKRILDEYDYDGEIKYKNALERKVAEREKRSCWKRNQHEIVKYNPEYYENSIYTNNEWTEFCDIGRAFDGKRLSVSEYLQTERKYIDVILRILCQSHIKYMSIAYYCGPYFWKGMRLETESREYYDRNQESFRVGKRIHITKLRPVLALMIRGICAFTFVNEKHKTQFEMGYDLYLHMHSELSISELTEIVNHCGLFIDPRSCGRGE